MLVAAAAFAQADQPAQPSSPPPASQPSTAQRIPARPTNTPESVADAARASRQAQESSPPTKIYRNKDVRDPGEDSRPASSKPAPPPAPTADQVFMEKESQFEAQGKAYKNQVLAQEAKIAGIQNNIQQLWDQFADWTTWYTDDGDVSLCWTDLGNTYYYKDYCDVGKNLRAQIEAAQRKLAQEKTQLENIQEDIRRKGYGNSIYEPD